MKTEYVYFVRAGTNGLVKIGTSTNVPSRLVKMQTDSSERLILLAVIKGGEDVEHRIHEQVAAHRAHGEWFHPHADLLQFIEQEQSANGVTLLHPRQLRVPNSALQAWRWSQDLTLRELAEKLDVAISYLSHLETGKRQPGWKIMLALVTLTNGLVMPNSFIRMPAVKREEERAA